MNERRHLVIAAIVAGISGISLIALGWWIQDWQVATGWDRLGEPGWWMAVIMRTLGFLTLGKVGFKIAFVIVAAVIGIVAWRRSARTPEVVTIEPEAATAQDAAAAPHETTAVIGK